MSKAKLTPFEVFYMDFENEDGCNIKSPAIDVKEIFQQMGWRDRLKDVDFLQTQSITISPVRVSMLVSSLVLLRTAERRNDLRMSEDEARYIYMYLLQDWDEGKTDLENMGWFFAYIAKRLKFRNEDYKTALKKCKGVKVFDLDRRSVAGLLAHAEE